MEFTPSPQQLLFLWCVVIEPEKSVTQLSYTLSPVALRDQLAKVGWIEEDRRSRSKFFTLTERGWYALEQNLNSEVSTAKVTPRAALKLLHTVLAGIARNIQQGRVSLSDVISDSNSSTVEVDASPTPPPSSRVDPDNLTRRVYEVCRRLTGDGIYNVRVRLADVRSQLAEVPRPDLDRALKELVRSKAAILGRLDDQREIGPDDEAAAIEISGGPKRHYLYLSRPR